MSDFGIGARLPRLEDARFLEGRGQFCADILLPGMLHAAFVRSPHAHATILSVRKPQSFEKRVYSAQDLTGVGRMRSGAKLPGFKPSDWPILAAGKVRHVGEPVAMVIGSTAAEAEDIAGLVEVDYAPLPPIVTMADALKKAAALRPRRLGRQHSCRHQAGRRRPRRRETERRPCHRAQLPDEPDAPAFAGRSCLRRVVRQPAR